MNQYYKVYKGQWNNINHLWENLCLLCKKQMLSYIKLYILDVHLMFSLRVYQQMLKKIKPERLEHTVTSLWDNCEQPDDQHHRELYRLSDCYLSANANFCG
jgi:hypothetical protein